MNHISDDQKKCHDASIRRGCFPARQVLQLGFEFRRTVLKDTVIIFACVLLTRLRSTFVSLITLRLLLDLELVLPALKCGFVVRLSEHVMF